MLCGVIAISKSIPNWDKHFWTMAGERVYLGSVTGSLEAWLGVRSLRTFELRVMRQSQNATALVAFMNECVNGKDGGDGSDAVKKVVADLDHASLQTEDMGWLKKQMPNGFGPVFSMWCNTSEQAKRLPSKLELFHHATSLGGVESLIEWRRMSDKSVEDTLLRVSVGVENIDDLKEDLIRGFKALVKEGW
jgi:cystathionine beta-lyase/cystathionine gamma-synthase